MRQNDSKLYGDVIINNVDILDKNNYSDDVETNQKISVHLEYKKSGETYSLNSVFINKSNSFNQLFEERKNLEETNAHSIATYKDNSLNNILNFQNCIDISNDTINSVYEKNKNKLVKIKGESNIGNGVFIRNNLVVTTWNFFQKILSDNEIVKTKDFSKITIKDLNDKNYTIAGIATISTDYNLIVIKTNEACDGSIELVYESNIETGVISISSQTAKGFSSQKGLIITNNNYIGATIPLSKNDEGGALFDRNGNVVGIATNISTNLDVSYYIKANDLKKVKDLFNGVEDIPTKSLEEIVNKYFLSKNSEVTKAKKKDKWGEYKKIGKLDKVFKLDLVKVTYKDKVFTARYYINEDKKLREIEDVNNYITQLEKQKYKKMYEKTNQIVYYTNTYVVTIQKLPHYLIVRIDKT